MSLEPTRQLIEKIKQYIAEKDKLERLFLTIILFH